MILQSPIFSGSVQISGSITLNDGPISATANIVSASTITDTFTSATSKVVNHGFDTKNVFVQVYNTSDELINPGSITTTDVNNVTITFPTPVSGRVIVGKSGHLVSGSAIAQSVEFDNILNKPALVSGSLDFVNITNKPALVSGSNIASASLAETAERVQAGTSGSRDLTTPQSGSLWYNTNTGKLEVYNGATGSGWSPLTVEVPQDTSPYSIEYLVVAGGGGTGYDVGGGGGAGGFLSGSFFAVDGYTYTATVGGGGGSGQTSDTKGTNGIDSTITGTGLTTITAIGGGGGGTYPSLGTGKDGGSGGGGGYANSPGGSGTAGQGNDGGSSASPYGSGGGGGAGGNGANGVTGSPVAGGSPAYSSITGTSVAYAGGGYGNADSGGVYQTGYNTSNTQVGVYGFGANGTGSPNNSPYSGNSGVVILKIPTSRYTGETVGSPTESVNGIYTILTFTNSGTYTA